MRTGADLAAPPAESLDDASAAATGIEDPPEPLAISLLPGVDIVLEPASAVEIQRLRIEKRVDEMGARETGVKFIGGALLVSLAAAEGAVPATIAVSTPAGMLRANAGTLFGVWAEGGRRTADRLRSRRSVRRPRAGAGGGAVHRAFRIHCRAIRRGGRCLGAARNCAPARGRAQPHAAAPPPTGSAAGVAAMTAPIAPEKAKNGLGSRIWVNFSRGPQNPLANPRPISNYRASVLPGGTAPALLIAFRSIRCHLSFQSHFP